MNLNLHDDYVYTRLLNLDLATQKQTANIMYEYVKHTYTEREYSGQDTMVYDVYLKYNYLMYALPGMHELYSGIKETFLSCVNHKCGKDPYDGKYYIQCWLNFYQKGQFIDWHKHWPPEYKTWHGFYCLDTEPNSHTSYKLPNGNVIDIKSQNNLIVLGPSDGDEHRSSEWNLDNPRITIAFDIVPAEIMFNTGTTFVVPNHWVPL